MSNTVTDILPDPNAHRSEPYNSNTIHNNNKTKNIINNNNTQIAPNSYSPTISIHTLRYMPSYSSCPTLMVLPSFSPVPAATSLRSGYLLLGRIKILHINHTTRKQPSSQQLTTKYPLNLSHSTAAKVNSIELFNHQYVFSSDQRSRFFLYIFLHYFAFCFHNYTTLCSYMNMISPNILYSPRPWQYIIIRTARLCSYRSKADHQEEKVKDQVIFGSWWSSSRPILPRPHEHWWLKRKWSCKL
jgi:hypothetical protein